jgi:uncharacterized protein
VPEPIVVLDTNVYISSFFWEGNPVKIIRSAIAGKCCIYISKDIINEIETVLKRDFALNADDINKLLNGIHSLALISEPARCVNIIKEDKSDNRILECGLACNAKFIVTGDQHLLILKSFEGIRIVSPAEFLEIF